VELQAQVEPPDWLVEKYDRPAPRYTSYPPAPTWTVAVDAAIHAQQIEDSAPRAAPLSVYVHVPFCRALCSYCGCNVVVRKSRRDADGYLDWLEKEMAHAGQLLQGKRRAVQLHWGGGTPNFLEEAQMTRLWNALASSIPIATDAEVSVELNPATCTANQLVHLRGLGFNRVSFGVQDLDPRVQRAVRRAPVGPHVRELMGTARELGFSGINFDLIYGLPAQTPERWGRTLDAVLELGPDRLAVYAFAFMPDAMPHQRLIDGETVPRGKDKLSLFRQAYRQLVGAGYQSIGMDHFARADDELSLAQARGVLRRNFQGYTVSSAPDVVAFGASAISDIGGVYTQNAHALQAYGDAVSRGAFATERGRRLTVDDLRRRNVIQRLMCNLRAELGSDANAFGTSLERLRPYEEDGLVKVCGTEVSVTPIGRFFVRNIAQLFDAYSAPAAEMASGI
jgi:oxygen-independent coproporphyrinogen-3 oxidase